MAHWVGNFLIKLLDIRDLRAVGTFSEVEPGKTKNITNNI